MSEEIAMFDRPIPGQSLTTEPGNRPWEQPAQYSKPEEALGYYMPRIMKEENASELMKFLKKDIPVSTVAEILTSAGAMEGKHTVDVSIIITPVLMELIKGMADIAGVKYKMTPKDNELDKIDSDVIEKIEAELLDIDKEEITEARMESNVLEEDVEQPTGLMARMEKM